MHILKNQGYIHSPSTFPLQKQQLLNFVYISGYYKFKIIS